MLIHTRSSAKSFVTGSADAVVRPSIAISSLRSHPSILNTRQCMSVPHAGDRVGNKSGSGDACDRAVDRGLARAGTVATAAVPKTKVLRPIIMWVNHLPFRHYAVDRCRCQHAHCFAEIDLDLAPLSNDSASSLTTSGQHAPVSIAGKRPSLPSASWLHREIWMRRAGGRP